MEDGKIHLFKTGVPILYFGSYISEADGGIDKGEWEIDTNSETGTCDEGSLNFGKPWPSPNYGNYYLYLARNGNVGIGKKCPSYKLDVNGDIATYGTLRISSDKRLKSNITSLSPSKRNNIYKLCAKEYSKSLPDYNYENPKNGIVPDSIFERDKANKKIKKRNSVEFGLIAQELMEIYPNLVETDSMGYYTVDYIGLIPIIIETLKEQKTQIDQQQIELEDIKQEVALLESCCNSKLKNAQISDENSNNESSDSDEAILYQNTPNPFNQTTEIRYFLPAKINNAYLIIYDMQGSQLKKLTLTSRGENTQIISGSEFKAGMFLYALIADGKEIGVKRMILTK